VKSNWLAASSFERTHELVSAINTVSVHAKFIAAGIEDNESGDEIQKARSGVILFLERLELLLRDAEHNQTNTVVGADPRLGELASRFLSERQRLPRRSVLYSLPMDRLKDLLRSESKEDMTDLVSCLHDLRCLVEQHSYADTIGILGDM
jgi:hypothetical protein